MYEKQHTLAQEFSLEGVGLHTGTPSRITIKPAPENYGFKFCRTDLPDKPIIPANLDFVVDLQRSTTIGIGETRIITIEHVLSGLAGYQIDNALIEVDGFEMPILDGSCLPVIEGLRKVGIVEQNANREFLVIEEPIHYNDKTKNIDLTATEYPEYRMSVIVDYSSQVLGIQMATMARIEEFPEQIAPNRTFCFWHELEQLVAAGLIKGGSLDNAVVIVDREVSQEELDRMAKLFGKRSMKVQTGYLNNVKPRFQNEPARHKLLDLVGDLSLVGAPIKGQIVAIKPGHASNIAFARMLKQAQKQKKIVKRFQKAGDKSTQGVVFDIKAVQQILPHRYPFLLVDRITHFTEKEIEGIKNVTINEPFFCGHFENNPIMPGVLIIEAMAQVGGILFLNVIDNPKDYWVYFLAVDNARFRKPVTPGDQLVFKLEMVNLKRNICKMEGKAYVDGVLVCEAELTASLVKKDSVK